MIEKQYTEIVQFLLSLQNINVNIPAISFYFFLSHLIQVLNFVYTKL